MKKFISVLMLAAAFSAFSGMTVCAEDAAYDEDHEELSRLVDMADVLDDSEEELLLERLDEVSERQQMDLVIITVDSLDGKTSMEYADDFYDYNGYGFGDSNDGLLLLVGIYDGTYTTGSSWISTTGYGITAFTDEGISYIGGEITPELLDGEYYWAFDEFITLCDDFITKADEGTPYDVGDMPKGEFPWEANILISLAVGLITALIVTGIMKSQLKSVRSAYEAADYVKNGSMKVTRSRDIFLYSHIDRTEKSKEDSSGGSSTHVSSSGETHGGGGF